MNVLIIENEVYLAQSMALKLGASGYSCTIAYNEEEIPKQYFDVILLSTNINNFTNIIKNNKNSVILLLVSYVSSDTVSVPIKMGAYDYIQKPFMIDELIRKIDYFYNFNKIKMQNHALSSYIKSIIDNKITHQKKLMYPILLKTNRQILADSFVFNYAFANDINIHFTDLSSSFNLNSLLISSKDIRYFTNFQLLKGSKLEQIKALSKGQNFIFHTTDKNDIEGFNCIELGNFTAELGMQEILSVDEYIRQIILTWQENYTDTDLSAKLGMSRKSLWEKRRKYGISKK